MNRIEMAQYITDEFMKKKKKAIAVDKTDSPCEARIEYEDGTTQTVRGKIAVDLLNAEEPQ